MPTQTTTAVVPTAVGWSNTPSEQITSRMPVRRVHPEPAIPSARMSPPRPMVLNPRIMSQKPRNNGSVAADSPTLRIRITPSTISMIPPASIHPRPVMK